MNARYARVSPISPQISYIRYDKLSSDTIPISHILNLELNKEAWTSGYQAKLSCSQNGLLIFEFVKFLPMFKS